MSPEPLLDKNTILTAFRRLASRLQHRHMVVDVYLFGGGAMVFALSEREATEDLDARFTSTSAAVSEVQAVAEELGLPSWWLNEQGTPYLPRQDEPYPVPVFDHPNLRVMRASDRHLLAMKLAASGGAAQHARLAGHPITRRAARTARRRRSGRRVRAGVSRQPARRHQAIRDWRSPRS